MADVKIETDVLIIGSGPSGATAAALFSTYGIKNVVVTKYGWVANTPRAHITNQRSMEVFRDLGVEGQMMQQAVRQDLMGNNVFCTSIAGEEIGRLYSWGTHPNRLADYTLASPTEMCDIPQTLLEPVLVSAGAQRGTKYRFNTEYISLEQDADGVTALVRDRLTQETYYIRAKYMIGADGGRSKVAADIGLDYGGEMGVGGSMNIVCKMDLTKYVAHRPSVLYWVIQPGSDVGGIGMGLVRMVRPWNEWLIVWGYDIAEGAPEVTDEMAKGIARKLVGVEDIDIEIQSTSTWTVNNCYAHTLYKDRVFCVGDAIHRHPPSNGLGSNTSLQDSFNLAWKVTAVLKGHAETSLLHSYQEERGPVAEQIVTRANKSIAEFEPIFKSLGLQETKDAARMQANMDERKENNPKAEEQREAIHQAIQHKSYEFNCHGVELNQRYRSAAIVQDGTPEPEYTRDHELFYQATTWPGAHLPHTWLGIDGRKISTLDLAGKGKFTVFTGIGGEAWAEAAEKIAAARGMEIETVVVGPGRAYTDLYGEWRKLREISDSGCLLIRPDYHIAFRAAKVTNSPEEDLNSAFQQILGK